MNRRNLVKAAAASTALAGMFSRAPSVIGQSTSLSMLLLGPSPELLAAFEEALIPEFESQESAKVELQTSDWGSAFQKITTSVATGTLPDILTVGGIWTAPLAAKGALLELDSYTAAWPDRAQYFEGAWNDCLYEGKTYAVPYSSDARTVVFRTDFMEEVGLDPAAPPTTWDEYKAAAAQLVVKDGDQITRQGADWGLDTSIGLQQAFAQLLFQAGGTYYAEDGSASFASDSGLKALEWLVSFYTEDMSSENLVQQPNTPPGLVGGTSAMAFANSSVASVARQSAQEIYPLLAAATPLKITADARPVTSTWVNKYGISAQADNPDLAWKWLAFINTPEALALQLPALGQLPARQDLSVADYVGEIGPTFFEANEYAMPQPPHPDALQIVQIINEQLQRAIRAQGTPEQILEAIDQEVNQLVGG
ncbi:MAG: extracellular solute-binding protein [Chloroflexota bacterium]|nr:extracellular solute-binding protein [Chloroflexota bacterium]